MHNGQARERARSSDMSSRSVVSPSAKASPTGVADSPELERRRRGAPMKASSLRRRWLIALWVSPNSEAASVMLRRRSAASKAIRESKGGRARMGAT